MHIRKRMREIAGADPRRTADASVASLAAAVLAAALLLIGRAALCADAAPSTTPAQTFPLAPVQSVPAQPARPGFGPTLPSIRGPVPADAARAQLKYAILLPLGSSPFARAADAVRLGFLAAATVAGEQKSVTVFAHGEADVVAAYENAVVSGAKIIVGPLVRDDLKQLLANRRTFALTLALNQPEDDAPLPRNVFTFGLAIESEAHQLANLLRSNGMQRVVVIADTSPLQRRLQSAFTQDWERLGGQIAGLHPYFNEPDAVYRLKNELAKSAADCLLLALDNEQARRVRAYLSEPPAYASSLIFDGLDSPGYHELDGVQFIEMPWLVQPDHSAVMVYRRANLGDPALERLYALGIDAFRLAYQLSTGDPPQSIHLDGVTGHVFLGKPQQFTREGVVLQIRRGHAAVLDAGR